MSSATVGWDMSAQTEQHLPDALTDDVRPIELQTENGFSIVRRWEIDKTTPPIDDRYAFIVHDANGAEREVIVDITDNVIAQTHFRTRGRVGPGNTFWICCAERRLANNVWENDDFPEGGRLRIDELDREDVMLALHWGSAAKIQ